MKKSTLNCHELTKISENYLGNFKKKLMLLLFVGFTSISAVAQDVPTCVSMAVSPAISCPNTVATATAEVVNIVSAQPVQWVIEPNLSGAFFVDNGSTILPANYSADGLVSTTINVGPNPGFGFTVVLQFINFPAIQYCAASPIVIQPRCNITGNDNVCPLSTNTYTSTVTGGSGATTHLWTVTGAATINGPNTGATVSVTAAAACGTFTLTDVVTRNGCQNTCEQTFNVVSSQPVIANLPRGGALGCNPPPPECSQTVTASDICGTVPVLCTAGEIIVDGCNRTQSFTYSATNACDLSAEPATVTYSWTQDLERPVITAIGDPTDGMLGCNPSADAISAALGTATATDNCGPVAPTFTDGDVISDGCSRSQTRTWNVTDACDNAAEPVSRTITWKVDITPPVITCAADRVIECGGTISFTDPTATDNCSGEIIITVVGTVTNADGSQTRTWKAEDACGNSAECSQTVSIASCAAEGCTLGYWKNHTDRWCPSYTTCMTFGEVFEDAPSALASLSLLEALNLGGGGINNLARQAVAALLNACSDEVDYPAPYLNIPQSVIDAVNAAYRAGGKEPGMLGSKLDMLNNTGCPLGGTTATSAETPSCLDNMKQSKNEDSGKAGFELFPVPFKDQLNIRYKFDYTSDVKIEVFNANGILMLTKADANGHLNKEITLNLNSSGEQEQVYLVKVTTNQGSSIKKVMSSK